MLKSFAAVFFIAINILTNILGILRSKLIAILWGVSNIGILGQLLTFYNLQTKIAIFGTKISLISLLNSEDSKNDEGIIISSFIIIITSNIILLSFILLFSNSIAIYLFKSIEHENLIILLGFIGPIYTIKDFIESLLQTKKKFKVIANGQVIGLIIALFCIYPLIYFFGILGVLYNFIIWFTITNLYYILKESNIFSTHFSNYKFIKNNFGKVFKIASLNVIRHVSIALSFVILRIIIVQSMSIVQAGYFQAVWGITYYINVLIAGFAFYFLPTIASLSKTSNFNEELNKNFEMLIHLIFPIILIIILFPSIILNILYSNEFKHLSIFLSLMSLGKVFESIYLFFIIILVSQIKFKNYFLLEIMKSILILMIPYLLIKSYGFAGSIAGIIIAHICSFTLIFIYIQNKRKLRLNRSINYTVTKFIIGLIVLITIPNDGYIYTIIKLLLGIGLFYFTLDYRKYFALFLLAKSRLSKSQ